MMLLCLRVVIRMRGTIVTTRRVGCVAS